MGGQPPFPLTDGGTFRDLRGHGLWICAVNGRVLSCPEAWEGQPNGYALEEAIPSRFFRKVTRPFGPGPLGMEGGGKGGGPSYLEQTYSAGMGKGRGAGAPPGSAGHRGEGSACLVAPSGSCT